MKKTVDTINWRNWNTPKFKSTFRYKLTREIMVVIEAGSVLIGVVFGYILVHTAYADGMRAKWDWKAYVAVLAAVVGGAGVDYLFKTSNVGYFWIGTFAGFVANLAIRWRNQGRSG